MGALTRSGVFWLLLSEACYTAMRIATRANVRTTAAARIGLNPALLVAFAGGTVMGMVVVGLGVLGLSLLYIIFDQMFHASWGTDRMLQVLQQLKSGHAILLVEHDMDAVFRIAERITVMVNGEVIASASPESIRSNRDVQLAYLGDHA